jgi:hypothetical protein
MSSLRQERSGGPPPAHLARGLLKPTDLSTVITSGSEQVNAVPPPPLRHETIPPSLRPCARSGTVRSMALRAMTVPIGTCKEQGKLFSASASNIEQTFGLQKNAVR